MLLSIGASKHIAVPLQSWVHSVILFMLLCYQSWKWKSKHQHLWLLLQDLSLIFTKSENGVDIRRSLRNQHKYSKATWILYGWCLCFNFFTYQSTSNGGIANDRFTERHKLFHYCVGIFLYCFDMNHLLQIHPSQCVHLNVYIVLLYVIF